MLLGIYRTIFWILDKDDIKFVPKLKKKASSNGWKRLTELRA